MDREGASGGEGHRARPWPAERLEGAPTEEVEEERRREVQRHVHRVVRERVELREPVLDGEGESCERPAGADGPGAGVSERAQVTNVGVVHQLGEIVEHEVAAERARVADPDEQRRDDEPRGERAAAHVSKPARVGAIERTDGARERHGRGG